MPTTSLNGIASDYETEGQGRPLVLIYGHSLSLRMWDDQSPVFSTKYRVIRYGVRGHDKSEVSNTCGHMSNVEQPRLFNWAVMDFLERLDESQ